jgi:hypothetical protein
MADPTLAGFKTFISKQGLPMDALPMSADVIPMAFNVAMTLVNQWLINVPSPDKSLPSLYALAVYNLAMDRVANYAQDTDSSPMYPGSNLPYWEGLRKGLNINGFVGGVISSASDNGTSQSMTTPEVMQNLTFDDLQTLKTRWGRTYMSLAQTFGQSDWGMS